MSTESNIEGQLEKILHRYIVGNQRMVLAFSGGLDSCVLLHLLTELIPINRLLVWHVHHGLLDCADDMADFAKNRAANYQLAFKISYLNLYKNQSNLESKAREARYREFEQGLNVLDILITAHHADDQAETLLLNLFRGSGSSGLRGIAGKRHLSNFTILRPLLDISRADLSEYARHHAIEWFEDPSNQDNRFDRNYLRNRVIPVIKQRWPGLLKSIARVTQIQSETRQILDEVAQLDYRKSHICPTRLKKALLLELSPARQKNVIRYWLDINQLDSLPTGRLESLISQLQAQDQAHPVIQGKGFELRIYDNQIFIVKPFDNSSLAVSYRTDQNNEIHIPPLGIDVCRKEILERLNLSESHQEIEIAFRNGSRLRRSQKHRLKRLFQKYRIPPWRRDFTPLIFIDGELKDILIL